MTELLSSRTFWLTALNLVLGVVVLAPLLLVLFAVARELLARAKARRKDVTWTTIPGLGRIPVLKGASPAPTRRVRNAHGRAHGSGTV